MGSEERLEGEYISDNQASQMKLGLTLNKQKGQLYGQIDKRLKTMRQ